MTMIGMCWHERTGLHRRGASGTGWLRQLRRWLGASHAGIPILQLRPQTCPVPATAAATLMTSQVAFLVMHTPETPLQQG